jgi:hypothetical protein
MKSESKTLSPPGEPANHLDLRSPKGIRFAEYLKRVGRDVFVTLRELRRQGDPPADVIVFDIEPERLQKLHNDIRGLETIAVLFGDDDQLYPEVLALREDFPMVPHVNRAADESAPNRRPRAACAPGHGPNTVAARRKQGASPLDLRHIRMCSADSRGYSQDAGEFGSAARNLSRRRSGTPRPSPGQDRIVAKGSSVRRIPEGELDHYPALPKTRTEGGLSNASKPAHSSLRRQWGKSVPP